MLTRNRLLLAARETQSDQADAEECERGGLGNRFGLGKLIGFHGERKRTPDTCRTV